MIRALCCNVVVLGIFLALGSSDAEAQRKWNWTQYGISWSVPNYMRLKENNAYTFRMRTTTLFERRNGWYFDFRITPWKNARTTAIGVAQYGLNSWTQQRVVTRAAYRANLKPWQVRQGLRAYVIWGQGIQNGRRNNYAVVGFIHKRSPVNFYIRAVWPSHARNQGIAVLNYILYSFSR